MSASASASASASVGAKPNLNANAGAAASTGPSGSRSPAGQPSTKPSSDKKRGREIPYDSLFQQWKDQGQSWKPEDMDDPELKKIKASVKKFIEKAGYEHPYFTERRLKKLKEVLKAENPAPDEAEEPSSKRVKL